MPKILVEDKRSRKSTAGVDLVELCDSLTAIKQ